MGNGNGRALWRAMGVLAAVIAAAAGAPASGQPVTCPGASCDVVVRVAGNPPAVSVSANELKMERGRRNVVITWKLASPDFEFRDDSIRPHTGAATGAKKTTSAADWDAQIRFLNQNGAQFRVRNANTNSATLFYDVTVFRKSDGAPFALDPAIINDF